MTLLKVKNIKDNFCYINLDDIFCYCYVTSDNTTRIAVRNCMIVCKGNLTRKLNEEFKRVKQASFITIEGE